MSFPKYVKYKDCNVEWLDEIPEHWDVCRIKDTTYLKGRVGWKGLTSEEYLDDGFAYLVTGTDFQFKYVQWNTCHCVDEVRYLDDPFIQLRDGDLLITKDGTIGKLALVSNLDRPACLNSGIFVVRPLQCYTSAFMYWILSSEVFTVFCDLASFGSTIQHLYQNVFERFSFPAPPISEQALIVAFLDRETAKIDSLVTEQLRLIELLKEKRQAVISHAVTKGLNPQAPMKPSGIEWIGDIPSHWEAKRLKYTCRLESGHTPRKTNEAFWIAEDCHIPWVSLNDTKAIDGADFINDTAVKISQIGVDNSSAHLIEKGAVIFTRDGARVGLAAITSKPMCVSQHIIAWVCGSEVINHFLLHVLYAMNAEIYRITAGSTIPTIGMPDVKRMAMPLPSLDEQKAIVEYLLNERQRISDLISEAERAIDLLQERRTALISAAVTGKIDVRGLAKSEAA